MLLEEYTKRMAYPLQKVQFRYQNGAYVGRGIMRWDYEKGFHIEAPVEPLGGVHPGGGFGYSRIKRSDLRLIKMRPGWSGAWYVAPSVFLGNHIELLLQDRLSINISRVLFSDPLSEVLRSDEYWIGSALYRLGGNVRFPHSVRSETFVGTERIERWSKAAGLRYESDQGEKLIGRIVSDEYFELNYVLPKALWSKTQAWRWGVSVQEALSICLSQTVLMLGRELRRDKRKYKEVLAQSDVLHIGRPFGLVNDDPVLDLSRFLALTRFLAKNEPGADVCRQIFWQIVAAAEQRSLQVQELLIATILEASLRTLEKHPFQARDKSFHLKRALNRFRESFLSDDWVEVCERAFRTHIRLRDRNAHPDWLYDARGALSEESQEEVFQDIVFLSRFYGYMILAIAGFRDLEPAFRTP